MKHLIYGLLLTLLVSGCSNVHVPEIKEHAAQTWAKAGFEIVGYEGYEYGTLAVYGGCVWYIVKRGTTTYDGCISKWGDEYHIYNLEALDAVKGN